MWLTKLKVAVLFMSLFCFQSCMSSCFISVPLHKFHHLIPELKALGHADESTLVDPENERVLEMMSIQNLLAKNSVSDDFYDRSIDLSDVIDFFNAESLEKESNEENSGMTETEANELVTSIYESFKEIASVDSDVWNIFNTSNYLDELESMSRKYAEAAVMEKEWDRDGNMEDIINRQYKIFNDYLKTGENYAKFKVYKIVYHLICESKMSPKVKEVLPNEYYDILKELSHFIGTPGISRLHLIKIAKFRLLYGLNALRNASKSGYCSNVLRSLAEEDYMLNNFCS